MRKLATIRKIDQLLPIEGADLIQLAKIDGWQCVVKKSEFNVGDYCVYFEIDSHLPIRPEFEILRRNSLKKMGDREGFRIKTIKLRGQLSQGLALPVHLFFNDFIDSDYDEGQELSEFFWIIGNDLSDLLDVQKYEAPIPAQLAGQVRGNFPGFIRKTDQERCQNMARDIFVDNKGARYEVTMKLDGSSFTAYRKDEKDGVCGRNWELDINEKNEGNSLVRMYVDSGLQRVLHELELNIAVQGELMGPGIQKNREGFASHKLFVFDIFNIDQGEYIGPKERRSILKDMYDLGLNENMVAHVPVIAYEAELYDTLGITDVDGLLYLADGTSINNPIREGIVFKRLDGKFSFKAISNKFLLKEED
jgi:RNA ligase (TIGR02306 family)